MASSSLTPELSYTSSLLQGIWNGSRLALSVLTRRGGQSGGAAGTGTAGGRRGSSGGGHPSSLAAAGVVDPDDDEESYLLRPARGAGGPYGGGAAGGSAEHGDEEDEQEDGEDGSAVTGESSRLLTGSKVGSGAAHTSTTAPALPSASASVSAFNVPLAYAFCRLFAFLIAPRPVFASSSSSGSSGYASSSTGSDVDPIIGRMYLLNALAFSPSLGLCKRLWLLLNETVNSPKHLLKAACYKTTAIPAGPIGVLTLFATVARHLATVADDYEMYQGGHVPLPLRETRHSIVLLRDVIAHAEGIGVDGGAFTEGALAGALESLVVVPMTSQGGKGVRTIPYNAWSEGTLDASLLSSPSPAALIASPPSPFWPRLAHAAVGALRVLYDRHSNRPLGPQSMWLIDVDRAALEIPPPKAAAGGGGGGAGAVVAWSKGDKREEAKRRLLSAVPFSLAFDVRAAHYWALRDEHRQASQTGLPQVRITVQRARLFESAIGALKDVRGEAMRRKLYVTFLNAEGLPESGIDAGGLFKELWTSLAAIVFDPTYGLFKASEQGEIYPNPESALCSGMPDDLAFEFVGRVLGKALYEGITIGPQFARFFLHKLLGRPVHVHHLPSLDPELYKSLMFIKTYDGNVEEDLTMFFTTSSDLSASTQETELVPGGASIPVTNANRMQYIYAVADWRLNKSIDRQCAAFLRGLRDVIPMHWLSPFSAPELQALISGSPEGIDVDDLRRYTDYAGGYHAVAGTVNRFWKVLAEMDSKDKAAVLRFVTSCSRPPPSGFRQLHPRFTIVKLSAPRPDEVLPMASTCFNVLKLPDYSSAAVMRERLLTAIHSGAGFELT